MAAPHYYLPLSPGATFAYARKHGDRIYAHCADGERMVVSWTPQQVGVFLDDGKWVVVKGPPPYYS